MATNTTIKIILENCGSMSQNVSFLHKDRVWENSSFGELLRANVYYTLYPYLFSFYDEEAFQNASSYAAYEAHSYFLSSYIEANQSISCRKLCRELLTEKAKLVADFRGKSYQDVDEFPRAFHQLLRQSRTPERPNFTCRIPKVRIKEMKRKVKGSQGADELARHQIFETCSNENSVNQRALVARFCEITRAVYYKQQVPDLSSQDKASLERFPKRHIYSILSAYSFHVKIKEEEMPDIINWHSPIAPLIYAMSSCVELSHNMREDLISNLPIIVSRFHEMYDIVVKEMLNNGREKYFKEDSVFFLDLPLPPSMPSLPRPSIDQDLDRKIMAAMRESRFKTR